MNRLDEIEKDHKEQTGSGKMKEDGGGREGRPLRVRLGVPDPEYRERPARRLFTAEFKRRIVRETENLMPGEMAAFLRRYGLFHAQVRLWKEQIDRGELEAVSPKKPGRKAQDATHVRELAAKDREIQRLREQLTKAETIIEVQKKISEILKIPLNPPVNEESD